MVPKEYSAHWLSEHLLSIGEVSQLQHDEIGRKLNAVESQSGKSKANTQGVSRKHKEATPAELISAMKLVAPDGLVLSEDRIMHAIAQAAGLEHRKIDPLKLDHQLITETMTRAFARKQVCLPLSRGDDGLVFSVDNPFDEDLLHQLRQLSGGRVTFVVSAKSDILRIITEIYGFQQSVKAAEKDISIGFDIGNLEQLVQLKRIDEIEANDQHIVNAVEYLLHYAYDQRASDIHIEPKRNEAKVRLRIDGVLHEIFSVPPVVQKAMVSRVKTLARMDIAEKRRPQDGRIKTAIAETEIELRVSSLPVAFGEKLVIRVFDPMQLCRSTGELGFTERQGELFSEMLTHRHGLILVTGPTGSGKTTTLYSALDALATAEVNVVTVEDPIEMVFESFNQVNVQRKIDLGFAEVLKSTLRQDPDIIMVGEIRDKETAIIAIQAALTGHLVLSTLHTNDSASAITRLRDIGVPSYLISSCLIGVVAQRLVRQVCPHCVYETELSAEEVASLEISVPEDAKAKLPVKRGKGCPNCRQTGLRGRNGVFEVLVVNEGINRLIREDADAQQIYRTAREDGMVSLRESALGQLAGGHTVFEEVVRVLGGV